MQSVTAGFKTAAVAGTITPVRTALIGLVDNQSMSVAMTPTATAFDTTNFANTRAINGITTNPTKWGFADPFLEGAGGRCLADGTWYPFDPLYEGGWKGGTLSDASGNIGGGGQTYVISYASAISMSAVEWWGDQYYGVPVDFTIAYDPTGASGYTTLATVTGNSAAYYRYEIGSTVNCKLLKITITKMQYGSMYACLLELQAGLLINVSTAVQRVDIIQERYPDNATIIVGNASAGELSLSQDNTSALWGPHSSSIYAPYLRSNRRIRYQVGFTLAGGGTELVPMGTFYSMRWSAPAGAPTAIVKAQDRMKRLRERKYRNAPMLQGQTVDAIIKRALTDAGLGLSEMNLATSSQVIPYAWCVPTMSYFDYVTQLAAVDGGVVYFDENDVFRFQDANYLHNNSTISLLTITDATALISAIDEWDEGEQKNRVVVNVNTLKLLSSAVIWNLQETLDVPASSSVTIWATLNAPAINITTPSFTQSSSHITLSSWTAYGQTVSLTFANSAGATETVLTCAISGQALQNDGGTVVTAESASVTSGLEAARELQINNTYVQTKAAASSIASTLLTLYSSPPAKIRIETLGLPHLELGDRITINSTTAGINADFWVIRHQFTDDGGLHSSIDAIACV